jgi:hypothetical protein
MSRETLDHLNTQTLIGFTDQRGTAWHYKQDLQSIEPNHYTGAIPVEDVRRRLFAWHAVEMPMHITTPDGQMIEVPNRKAIVRDDTSMTSGCSTMSVICSTTIYRSAQQACSKAVQSAGFR